MNHHELLDVAALRLSGLLARSEKIFARSTDAPPLVEVADAASATVEDVRSAGRRDVTVETPVGDFEAAYMPWQWRGPEYPTVVYHHGSGEQPFDFGRFASNTFRGIFVETDEPLPWNVVAVRAPFHDRSREGYADAMGDLSNLVGMVAASTALAEAIRAQAADRTDAPVVLSGTSLGGFVTNLHRARHGSADRYVPLLAGAAFGEVFVSSVYRHLTAESALRRPDHIRSLLDFVDAFRAVDADDCTPLLARHDRVVEFEAQRSTYADREVTVLEKGHLTGALATTVLRDHLRETVPTTDETV